MTTPSLAIAAIMGVAGSEWVCASARATAVLLFWNPRDGAQHAIDTGKRTTDRQRRTTDDLRLGWGTVEVAARSIRLARLPLWGSGRAGATTKSFTVRQEPHPCCSNEKPDLQALAPCPIHRIDCLSQQPCEPYLQQSALLLLLSCCPAVLLLSRLSLSIPSRRRPMVVSYVRIRAQPPLAHPIHDRC